MEGTTFKDLKFIQYPWRYRSSQSVDSMLDGYFHTRLPQPASVFPLNLSVTYRIWLHPNLLLRP